jgi:hypothetical protein
MGNAICLAFVKRRYNTISADIDLKGAKQIAVDKGLRR